ncbi:MAG: Bifunctional oligoribonuclease and PAP phosphatase NrnA [candidate division WS2 bacterium ADurb.Bin280]|uniref:Bifunctional oligoribonuclease and PAP phosphatase NrnA n=1 Tax=candidate division WS2 bacterium ADurb.Bin280 TaxID=1852829 RepID=A0A1V5SDM7_9BACT|nr:MAG: Bifunctional oligoribonuclease and PAP phosphatase NrnA [candidate division WS2 bacterium ADurb.Bin280]
MEASVKQQASELIKGAQSILLVGHKNPDGDALGSLLALKIVLEKMGKKTDCVTSDAPNKIFNFLPRISEIGRKIEVSDDFIISVDTSSVEIEKIGYKKEDSGKKLVNIVITPRGKGRFSAENISFPQAKPKYDLIISVDTPNIERLGEIAPSLDIFYEIPLINIDHHPSNEKFGKINLVELVATSTSEILVSLFESLSKDNQIIDADVATCLLTGLIYDTSSFQNVNTTPKSLTIAAQLVAAGARQQEIVKNLYKTKSMETLKLWGLVLTKVSEDKENKFLYSSVSREDLEKTGADESALSGVIDELLKSATEVDFALLLSERQGYVHGSLRSIAKGVNVARIAESFGGGGHEVAAAFRVNGTLKDNQQTILEKIAKMQKGNGAEKVGNEPLAKEVKSDENTVAEKSEEMVSPTVEDVETGTKGAEQAEEPEKTEQEQVKEVVFEKSVLEAKVEEVSESETANENELISDAQRVADAILTEPQINSEEPIESKEDDSKEDRDASGRVITKW